ncbi:MAG TPA: response regulator [Anaerolineales bacterium]|nr:response regulator [Anaerolineales bacterium]
MADNLRVLYIEDNPDNQLLVRRVLMSEGYDVILAANGQDGLQLAKSAKPNVILVDINMPGVDGYTVTAALRQMSHLTQVPIIALTANVMKGDREKTLAAGCDGYIQKPIDIDSFPKQLARYIQETKVA